MDDRELDGDDPIKNALAIRRDQDSCEVGERSPRLQRRFTRFGWTELVLAGQGDRDPSRESADAAAGNREVEMSGSLRVETPGEANRQGGRI